MQLEMRALTAPHKSEGVKVGWGSRQPALVNLGLSYETFIPVERD